MILLNIIWYDLLNNKRIKILISKRRLLYNEKSLLIYINNRRSLFNNNDVSRF